MIYHAGGSAVRLCSADYFKTGNHHWSHVSVLTNLTLSHTTEDQILYSRRYWRELNLVVEPASNITIAIVLVDLNMMVRYGITMHYKYICETLVDF